MRKLVGISLAVVLTIFLAFGTAFAQASAKATAQCSEICVVDEVEVWTPIFEQTIKMPESKELVIDVSLECGLTTNTKVISKQLVKDIAEAEALVKVRVILDGDTEHPVCPGEVTFARRYQKLIAEFAGDISGALSIVDGALVIDEDLIQPETLQLILDTMTANSFNFIAMDVPVGDHTITVEAMISYTDTDPSEAEGLPTKAYLGKGSVTIHNSRMIKDEDVVIE